VTVVIGAGAEIVVIRSVVVVCAVQPNPQTASNAMPLSDVAAGNSRVPGSTAVTMDLLVCAGSGALRTDPADLLLGAGRACLLRRCDHGR
jgi:hypothetical protein